MRYFMVYINGKPEVVMAQEGNEQISGKARAIWLLGRAGCRCRCVLIGTVTSEYEIVKVKDLGKWFRRNGWLES